MVFGTGLPGDPGCTCPYCGHHADHDQFWTKDQIEYVRSYAANYMTKTVLKELKKLELKYRPPRRGLGIGFGFKVRGRPPPVRFYQERELETRIECKICTLSYAVYGVFGFCPDCGVHNSQQILEKNFEIVSKMLDMASSVEADLHEHLIGDALENAVSSFDGFGREICRIHAAKASDPGKAESISFQNPKGAQKNILALFVIDIAAPLTADEWDFVHRGFQKRHVITHKMGVIDDAYVKEANDPGAVVGHKIKVDRLEVERLTQLLLQTGSHLASELQVKP